MCAPTRAGDMARAVAWKVSKTPYVPPPPCCPCLNQHHLWRLTMSCHQAGAGVQAGTNVLGGPLGCCCTAPLTGYFRDGFCRTGAGDMGVHVVCAQVRAGGGRGSGQAHG
jgi:hypothetical protein